MVELTEEQKEQYNEFMASSEYREYMNEMIIKLEPLTEDVIEPIIWKWYCEEHMGIVFEEYKKPEKEFKPPSMVVYDNEEEFLKANPHIDMEKIKRDEGYSEPYENNNISIKVNDELL